MSEHYDLVVIGAGPAGKKGAAQAAYFGKRVCIVERAPKPGGAMVNTGTIPARTLRETAAYFSGFRQRGVYGVDLRVKPGIMVGDFMQRERNVIETEWELIAHNIQRHHIATIQGTARFIDAHTLEVTRYGVTTRRLSADVFLVATGARPAPPVGYALDGEVVVDSDSLLALQRIPASMIVIGGGVIGCEYACTFAAFGTRVTVISERARLISHLDRQVSDALRRSMTARLNVTVYANADVRTVEVNDRRAAVTLRDGTYIAADLVLVATGRIGNTTSLGLAALGIRTNALSLVQ